MRSSYKNDPASIAHSMMSAMESQGKRMFSSEEPLDSSPDLQQRSLSLMMMILKTESLAIF